uniref:Uncharacterized protein n=1 Tax=Ananas comosus var. bracteatus TaxID=296719 RepID=A0A6V7P017_ANACO|nr:unnamed protein product [Ananas comosus var. bracteatus]
MFRSGSLLAPLDAAPTPVPSLDGMWAEFMVGPSSRRALPVSDASFRSPPRVLLRLLFPLWTDVGPSSWSALLPVAPFRLATLRSGLFIPFGHENGSDSFSLPVLGFYRISFSRVVLSAYIAHHADAEEQEEKGKK